MDKEFIERKTLLKDINESVIFSTRNGRSAEMRGAQKVVNRILEAPAVDVAEVKHGEWIAVPSSDMSTGKAYKCSECSKMRYGVRLPPYCQECGAKMDGVNHFTDAGKMVLPWFSADNKSLLEKVLFFHKVDYPSEMDMELIVIIEGAMQPTILFYDGINFYSEEANGDICFHKVTHWMPLPAPPEKGDVE